MKKKRRRIILLLVVIVLVLLLLRHCNGPRKKEVNVPQPPTISIQEKTDTIIKVNPVDSVVPEMEEATISSVSLPKPVHVSSVTKTVRVTAVNEGKAETPEEQSTAQEVETKAPKVKSTTVEEVTTTPEVEPPVTESEVAEEAEARAAWSAGTEAPKLFKNAIGVVFTPDIYGNSPMVSIQLKHFINAGNSIDIRAGYQINWGPEVSALFEWNFPVRESGFRFYAGPGVHIGLITNYTGNRDSCLGLGLASAVGFEYIFPGSPFALSLDWHPYLTWQPSVDNKAQLGWNSFQIGVKYCF